MRQYCSELSANLCLIAGRWNTGFRISLCSVYLFIYFIEYHTQWYTNNDSTIITKPKTTNILPYYIYIYTSVMIQKDNNSNLIILL